MFPSPCKVYISMHIFVLHAAKYIYQWNISRYTPVYNMLWYLAITVFNVVRTADVSRYYFVPSLFIDTDALSQSQRQESGSVNNSENGVKLVSNGERLSSLVRCEDNNDIDYARCHTISKWCLHIVYENREHDNTENNIYINSICWMMTESALRYTTCTNFGIFVIVTRRVLSVVEAVCCSGAILAIRGNYFNC